MPSTCEPTAGPATRIPTNERLSAAASLQLTLQRTQLEMPLSHLPRTLRSQLAQQEADTDSGKSALSQSFLFLPMINETHLVAFVNALQ